MDDDSIQPEEASTPAAATTLCKSEGIRPLGIGTGEIPDDALTASSSYNEQSVGPQNARYTIDTIDRIYKIYRIVSRDVENNCFLFFL